MRRIAPSETRIRIFAVGLSFLVAFLVGLVVSDGFVGVIFGLAAATAASLGTKDVQGIWRRPKN